MVGKKPLEENERKAKQTMRREIEYMLVTIEKSVGFRVGAQNKEEGKDK